MKILIATLALPPYLSGVATFTASLAQELSKTEDVLILSSTPAKKPQKKVITPHLTHWLFPGIKFTHPAKLTLATPHLTKVQEIFHQFKPDVVHLQDFSPICLSTLNAANNNSLPCLITHHFTAEHIFQFLIPSPQISNRLSYSPRACKLLYRLLEPIYNRCQQIVVPNPKLIPLLQKAKFTPPISSISNGIISHNFVHKKPLKKILKQYGITQSKLLLFVGRLDPDKNLHQLIEAFQPISQLNPDAGLVFIGDGNQKNKLQKIVKKLNLKSTVYFLGKIDNQSRELSYLYNAAYLYVNPSIIENQSVSFIEAMTAGLPIVAANQAIQSSLIQPNINGLLFQSNSIPALTAALQKLLSDSRLRRKISSINRKTARIYDVHFTSQQYLRAYRLLL